MADLYTIRWTADAVNDLEQIFGHIMKQNPAAARDVIRTIAERIGVLKTFSNLGRIGQVAGTRELIFAPMPYVAVYRLKDHAVEILRVYHAAQDWP
jgi:toxin ParE1/3/4